MLVRFVNSLFFRPAQCQAIDNGYCQSGDGFFCSLLHRLVFLITSQMNSLHKTRKSINPFVIAIQFISFLLLLLPFPTGTDMRYAIRYRVELPLPPWTFKSYRFRSSSLHARIGIVVDERRALRNDLFFFHSSSLTQSLKTTTLMPASYMMVLIRAYIAKVTNCFDFANKRKLSHNTNFLFWLNFSLSL